MPGPLHQAVAETLELARKALDDPDLLDSALDHLNQTCADLETLLWTWRGENPEGEGDTPDREEVDALFLDAGDEYLQVCDTALEALELADSALLRQALDSLESARELAEEAWNMGKSRFGT